MMLKGIDEINKVINEFLEPFELTAELGTDFDYCFLEDKVHYALIVRDTSSKLFMENAEASLVRMEMGAQTIGVPLTALMVMS